MSWVAISGSWRKSNDLVERDVRTTVRAILERGDGIVTGGALGVDYFATDEALRFDPRAKCIKVFLPVRLSLYSAHYRRRANEGVITASQAEMLIAQLETLQHRNPDALIENNNSQLVNTETYFERNTRVVDAADMLEAFQVNMSQGVQDTIDKAKARSKPVNIHTYSIP